MRYYDAETLAHLLDPRSLIDALAFRSIPPESAA
jgi:hypothetical protein